MPEKDFLKELIRQTLKRVADLGCTSNKTLNFYEDAAENFVLISAQQLYGPSKHDKGWRSDDPDAYQKGPTVWPLRHQVTLTLFAEGLMEAFKLCVKAECDVDELCDIMATFGMDLHEAAQQVEAQHPKTRTGEPSEEQLQAIRVQSRQKLQLYIENLEVKPEETATSPFQVTRKKLSQVLQVWRSCKRTFWAVYEGRTKEFSNFPPIASQRLPSAYTGIAWLGPFLIWWLLNTTAAEALKSAPFIPVVGLGVCLLWEWAKTGFFRLQAFPLLGLAGLNTGLLFAVELDFRLTLLLNGLILLGMLCLYGLEQEHQRETEKAEAQKEALSETINPNRMYKKLEMNRLMLQVDRELLCLVKPDEDGQVLEKIAKLREDLTKELGYIIPNVRIQDAIHLDKSTYQFLIREIPVGASKVFPGRFRVLARHFAELQLETPTLKVPEKPILDIDPVQPHENVYWLPCEEISEALHKESVEATDAMIEHIRALLIRHVDSVLDHQQVLRLHQHVREQNSTLANDVLQTLLSVEEMRKLLVNLLREQVSIRDIELIYERLSDYAREDQDPDSLCEKIRLVLKQRICADLKLKDKPLLSLKLSAKLEKQILKACQAHEDNRLERCLEAIDPTFCQEVRDKARPKIRQAEVTHQATPAILCTSPVRLALFRILEKEFPFITVLAYPELTEPLQVEFLEEL